MLDKGHLDDVIKQINECRVDLAKIMTDYANLEGLYHSYLQYGMNQSDKDFFENNEKGKNAVREFEKKMMATLSELESDAINSSDSWVETIPTAFK